MMKKEITSSKKIKAEVIEPKKKKTEVTVKPKFNPSSYDFPAGSQFLLWDKVHYVRKAMHEDNTDFRLIFSEGSEEIIMLTSLQIDAADDKEFLILEK